MLYFDFGKVYINDYATTAKELNIPLKAFNPSNFEVVITYSFGDNDYMDEKEMINFHIWNNDIFLYEGYDFIEEKRYSYDAKDCRGLYVGKANMSLDNLFRTLQCVVIQQWATTHNDVDIYDVDFEGWV